MGIDAKKGRWANHNPDDRFDGFVDKSGECWVWTGRVRQNGYPYGLFSRLGRSVLAHRWAWVLANKRPIPAGLCVCHHCDNPRCVRPDHLFLGTMKDNCADRDQKGRGRICTPPTGETHHRAKLSAEQARDIYRRVHAGERASALAREYGIDPERVSRIKTRQAWKAATAEVGHRD